MLATNPVKTLTNRLDVVEQNFFSIKEYFCFDQGTEKVSDPLQIFSMFRDLIANVLNCRLLSFSPNEIYSG